MRITIGPRDLQNGTVEIARRDTYEKMSVSRDAVAGTVASLMEQIQENIYKKAYDFRESRTCKVDTYDEFKEKIENGYFVLAHWDGTPETEEKIKDETKATIRCIPIDTFVVEEEGRCIYSGRPSSRRVLFAKAY